MNIMGGQIKPIKRKEKQIKLPNQPIRVLGKSK